MSDFDRRWNAVEARYRLCGLQGFVAGSLNGLTEEGHTYLRNEIQRIIDLLPRTVSEQDRTEQ